jgi:hypothetical protein
MDRTCLLALALLVLAACARDKDPVAATAATSPPAADTSEPVAHVPAAASTSSIAMAGENVTAAHFARLDGDGNGSVTASEHVASAAAMFKAMDADGNGRVTAAEMDAAQAAMGGDSRMASADKIRVIDLDGDGELTAEEHADGSRTMFATMDTDGDGRLTLAEVQAGHDAMLGAHQGAPPPQS